MKKILFATLILAGCTPTELKEKMYIVRCNWPQDKTVDTITTTRNMWVSRTTYRIVDVYYPTSFCTVETKIKS